MEYVLSAWSFIYTFFSSFCYKGKKLKIKNLETCFPVWMVHRKWNLIFQFSFSFLAPMDLHGRYIVSKSPPANYFSISTLFRY